jgi:succinyl-diaminopimelate desuccinylase
MKPENRKSDFSAAVAALKKLLQIDSTETPALLDMPFGKGNADALAFSLDLLKELGFRTQNVDNFCGFGEVGEGELFGVLGHLDVVPAGENWTYPPFGATEANGNIYARGALDDKGPMIAAIFAAVSLLEEGYKPKKRLRFILGCDEESGWLCMERYAKTEEMPALGFSPDSNFPVINCEKGVISHEFSLPLPEGLLFLTAGTRVNVVPDTAQAVLSLSSTSYRKAPRSELDIYQISVDSGLEVLKEDTRITITARGKSAHGSHPEAGDNALLRLLKVLGVLYPSLQSLHNAFSDYNGGNIHLGLRDKESGKLTLNLGTASTENETLRFQLDIRYPITFQKEDITRTLQRELPFCEIKQLAFHPPLYVPPDNPLVTALLEAYNGVTGETAAPLTIGGATYARCLPLGVAFGPVFPRQESTIHQKDEFISLKDFRLMIEIYKRALQNLCF